MSVHETRHALGECIHPHRHEQSYAALVLEGAYEEAGPDGVWRVEAGDLIVHPPFHLHLNRFGVGNARVLNVTLTHGAARWIGIDHYAVLRPRGADQFLRRLTRDAGSALGETMEECSPRSAREPRDWLDGFAIALRGDPLMSIASLARAAGVTPTHAARAFARRFGQTPAAFRKEQRLRIALQALAHGEQSLAEVAIAAGYADQAHMTRALAAATGATPAKLRRALH